jgi:hypothetical protein
MTQRKALWRNSSQRKGAFNSHSGPRGRGAPPPSRRGSKSFSGSLASSAWTWTGSTRSSPHHLRNPQLAPFHPNLLLLTRRVGGWCTTPYSMTWSSRPSSCAASMANGTCARSTALQQGGMRTAGSWSRGLSSSLMSQDCKSRPRYVRRWRLPSCAWMPRGRRSARSCNDCTRCGYLTPRRGPTSRIPTGAWCSSPCRLRHMARTRSRCARGSHNTWLRTRRHHNSPRS